MAIQFDMNDVLRMLGTKEMEVQILRQHLKRMEEEVEKMAKQIAKDHGEPT
jgi:cob(I)alamin adenosyltransferase